MNPFETIKVRLQNEGNSAVKKYKSFGNGFKVIMSEEGVKGLWKGTIPAICRELIYTSSRMGLYKPIKDLLLSLQGKSRKPGPERIWEKLVGGGTIVDELVCLRAGLNSLPRVFNSMLTSRLPTLLCDHTDTELLITFYRSLAI